MGIILKGIKKVGIGKVSSIISADVYNDVGKRQNEIWGYKYLQEYSTPEISVYKNDETKSIIIGNRGTSNLKDIGTDILLVGGNLKNTSRQKELNNLIQRLKNTFKGYHITTTGHSLANALSKNSTSDLSIGFNAGTPLFGNTKEGRHIDKRIEGDPISLLSKVDETLEKDPRFNSHTIKQFADLQTS
jgi:hypothetical protein